MIVAADADLEVAATKLAANAFAFAGQSCISVQRVYVERPAYDAFLETFVPKVEALKVGDPADDETDVGPVIDEGARERILAWIDEATRSGAKLLVGGVDGSLIRPTALAQVGDEQKVSCEEVFGPVVIVNPVDSIAEGVDRHGAARGRRARVRRRHRQRGPDLPQRPDALRRREGLRQYARGAGLCRTRDDRGPPRRDPALADRCG